MMFNAMLRKIAFLVSLSFLRLLRSILSIFRALCLTNFMLRHLQLIPALMGLHLRSACFIANYSLFGRVYCSSICPMGVYQDIVTWAGSDSEKKKFKYKRPLTVMRWSVVGITLIAFFTGLLFSGGFARSLQCLRSHDCS